MNLGTILWSGRLGVRGGLIFCCWLLFGGGVAAQTLGIVVTNGTEDRCFPDTTVEIRINPNPAGMLQTLVLTWGDAPAVTFNGPFATPIQFTYNYPLTQLLQGRCDYECSSLLAPDWGDCFQIQVLATYANIPDENAQKYMHFFRPPNVSLGYANRICSGSPLSFDNNTCPRNDTSMVYFWDFGDGTFATTTDLSPDAAHTYAQPGMYTVTLTATNRCGTVVRTFPVEVVAPPLAFAQVVSGAVTQTEPYVVCLSGGGIVELAAQTAANITTYNWLPLGAGAVYVGPTNQPTATVDFNQPGNYSVILRVDNPECAADQDTLDFQVVLDQPPILNPQPDVCQQSFNYQPQPFDPAVVYERWLNNTWQLIAAFPLVLSNETVIIRATRVSSCNIPSALDTFTVSEPATIVQVLTSDTVCLGIPYPLGATLSVNPVGAPVQWTLNGAAVPQNFVAPQPGTFTLAYAQSGCNGQTGTFLLTVLDTPSVSLPTVLVSCDSVLPMAPQVSYGPFGPSGTVLWQATGAVPPNATGPAPVFTFAQSGTYTIVAQQTIPVCGTRSDTMLFTRNEAAAFVLFPAVDTLCVLAGTLDLNDYLSPQVPGAWSGPGLSGSVADLGTLGPGTYSYTFTEALCGEAQSFVLMVAAGNVQNDLLGICLGQTLDLVGQFGPCAWTDANGGPVAQVTPAQAGVYVFTCANDPNAFCSAGRTVTLTVYDTAAPQIAFSPECEPGVVLANDTLNFEVLGGHPILSFDLGDGSATTQSAFQHVYAIAGTYQLVLAVGYPGCALPPVTQTITVAGGIQPTSVILDTVVTCDSVSVSTLVSNLQAGYNYTWTLPGGAVLVGPAQSFSVPRQNDDSVYVVQLLAETVCESQSQVFSILVAEKLAARFAADSLVLCSGTPLHLDNYSSGSISAVAWYVEGVLFSTLFQPDPLALFTDTLPRWVEIMLVVFDTLGCGPDTAFLQVQVRPASVRASAHTPGQPRTCAGEAFTLYNLSTPGALIEWNLLGQTFTGDTLEVVFPQPGQYLVVLTVFGCGLDRDSLVVTVSAVPQLSVSADSILCPQELVVTQNGGDPSLSYVWQLGGAAPVAGFAPLLPTVELLLGQQALTVTAVNTDTFLQCAADTVLSVFIFDRFPIDLLASDLSVCAGEFLTLWPSGADNYAVNWGDGNFGVGAMAMHSYTAADTFTITVSYWQDGNPCSVDTNVFVTVLETPGPVFSVQDTAPCSLGRSLFLLPDSLYFAHAYAWSANGQVFSTNSTAEFEVLAPGSYNFGLTLTNAFGCSDSAYVLYEVLPLPDVSLVSADTSGCAPFWFKPVFVELGDWLRVDFGNGFLFEGPGEAYLNFAGAYYSSAGFYTVSVTMERGGCVVDTGFVVHIYALPNVVWPSDTIIPIGRSIDLELQVDTLVQSVRWRPATYLPCPDCLLNEGVMPLESIVYTINYETAAGCTDSNSVIVKVFVPDFEVLPTAFTPNGDGINDGLVVRLPGFVDTVVSYRIFDRWNQLVFERTNFPSNTVEINAWEGNLLGQPAPPGGYSALVRVRLINGETVDKVYHFQLQR